MFRKKRMHGAGRHTIATTTTMMTMY